MAAKTAKTAQAETAADELKPCECAAYDALPADLTDADIETGDFEVLTTGCTATTKRQFAPGHDAKLKSALIRWGSLGLDIRRTDEGGVATSASADKHAARYAFAHMVTAGVKRAEAKAAEKARKAEERAARKAAPKAPKKVTAKVGRATVTGHMDGDHFVYEVKGKERRTLKFQAA
ncbi:hypothetical protein [Streptomyces sp. NRRL S-146]|uniref:hypothetical protein n=1 Tax=Streptomyces sp. NRRL S-146 TaxID=1463884 RepID=UPI00068941DE|nr:hypothetical protein [Streptomyces sp. NRRL S-146]